MIIISNNTIVWGFNSEGITEAIKQLNDEDIINIKAWVGNNLECTHNVFDLILGEFKKQQYYGNCQNVIYDEIFHKTFYKYMDMMTRHSFHTEKLFHEKLNIYNILYDLFANMLVKQKITTVLFSNIPHEGPDYVLYQIAKSLDINVIMLYQSLIPNRFFYICDIDDFGNFQQTKPANDYIPTVIINHEFKKELSYMDKVKSHQYGLFSLQRNKNILSSSIRCIFRNRNKKRIKEYTNKSKNIKTNNKHKFLIFDLTKRVINYSIRLLQRFYSYRISRDNYFSNVQIPNLSKNYIYFPLQLQPELTTSSLGNMYTDQLLAIERLSRILPDNWFIYVKENPKQTELMRNKWFYDRLKCIGNVKLFLSTYNTYKLLEYCKMVATITGTVGWEAITGDKNVLVFGNAWYNTLPGVFAFKNTLTSEDILFISRDNINHTDLGRKFNKIINKTYKGIIDGDYFSLTNTDINTNVNDVFRSLKEIIEESP